MSTNNIKLENIDLTQIKCPVIEGKQRISESYLKYTVDESKMQGSAPDRIYFPTNTLETAAAMIEIANRKENITISGARTGISGGAVNVTSENIISLEKIIFIPEIIWYKTKNSWSIKAGAGTTLEELRKTLINKDYITKKKPEVELIYPVDPTETSASIGGTIATNASGARTLFYGPTRKWVKSLTIVLINGQIMKLQRGQYIAENGEFKFSEKNKPTRCLKICDIAYPETKHVAGYNLKHDMDLIDLFIGSEGTLGIITEFELFLTPVFPQTLYLYIFCDQKINVAKFVTEIKDQFPTPLLALEYMDSNSIELLKEHRKEYGESTGIPELNDSISNIFYLESGFKNDIQLDEIEKKISGHLNSFNISTDLTWAGFSENDSQVMKKFRHALPEKVNSIISERKRTFPNLTKIGTDMAVSDDNLYEILEYYHEELNNSGIEHVVFGHIGNGHVHINFLPQTMEEIDKARKLYKNFAKKIVSLGGSVSAEHGIGKLKKVFFISQFSEKNITSMTSVKIFFDPEYQLNPNVIFVKKKP
ncbi:FAD-binding oxidoreductase [bacterium]|nr:FAD-binding oxidoreductase [bacterium]